MPFPKYDRVLFEASPLRLVIGQVRFPLLFRFNEKPFLAAFQEAIQPEYPRVAQEQQLAVKFSNKGLESVGESLWRFAEKSGNYSVVLGEGALTLESKNYESIDRFVERFERILKAAVQHLKLESRTRLGLRFINEMRVAGADKLTDWSTQLNPKLVGYAGSDLLDGTIEHAFHDIKSKRDNGTLVIRHGLLNGTTIEPRPADPPTAAVQGPFYLLDLDYSDENECPLDIDSTVKRVREYNESIYQMFRWAIDHGSIYQQFKPKPAP